MKVIALLLVIAVGVATAIPKLRSPKPELDKVWEEFKQAHGKKYTQGFELLRRLIFEDNVKFIEKHNLEFQMGLHTYDVGVNQFADMTNDEFRSLFLGTKFDATTVKSRPGRQVYMAPIGENLQATDVDWRTKGYVTKVKNQEQCGSCWSFSATGSLEGQHFKKTGQLVSLSEQNLVDCSGSYGNMGCNGGLMDYAFEYIRDNRGIDTEASYRYEARNGRCRFNRANVGATCTGYVDIPQFSESGLQSAVKNVGPISVAIDASHQSFQLYRSGIYNEPSCSQTQLDHGVLAVGYGSQNGRDYWIVKNSWGAGWGMQGYLWMSRNKNNQCGIATSASYPTV